MSDFRERLEQMALTYHTADDGEGEYGCPGATCPGVHRLTGFAQEAARETLDAALDAAIEAIQADGATLVDVFLALHALRLSLSAPVSPDASLGRVQAPQATIATRGED